MIRLSSELSNGKSKNLLLTTIVKIMHGFLNIFSLSQLSSRHHRHCHLRFRDMSGRVRFYCFVMIVQVMSWVGVTSRPFAPNHDLPQPGTEQRLQTLQVTLSSKDGNESITIEAEKSEERSDYKGVDQIGSRPPSCEHKCYGCMPCEAIQVPTTTSSAGLQYTNYEPESWKCKCGPSFYSP